VAITTTSQLAAAEMLEGVDVTISPEFATVELSPAAPRQGLDQFGQMWHWGQPQRSTKVTVSAADGRPHKVALRIEGADSRWRPGWTRWSFLQRKASELEGGVALDAQDEVLEDGRLMVALIKEGETRSFTLELLAELDGQTEPGTYGFDVVAIDSNEPNRWEVRRPGFLTLTHPRSKLLDQLPAIFGEEIEKMREDSEGESPFFERFLLGFEDAMRPLQRTLDRLDTLFGPYSTPSEFLLWLGAWLCVPVDENWTEMQRRSLIREAVQLYRWRGTKKGLSRYLQIYTGVVPEINDQPVQGMRLGPDTKLGAATTMLGDVPAHTFVVTIAAPDPTVLNEQVIHDIITYEKPAHTAYALRIVRRTA
jgi:phage tail-like protein